MTIKIAFLLYQARVIPESVGNSNNVDFSKLLAAELTDKMPNKTGWRKDGWVIKIPMYTAG